MDCRTAVRSLVNRTGNGENEGRRVSKILLISQGRRNGAILSESSFLSQEVPTVDPRIQRVVASIEGDPHQRFSLEIMARTVGLSSSRLRHKFKSEVGITPTVYLQIVRMKVAAELLRKDLSVKEVRAAIGLESDSYFTHQCQRMFGVPPSRIKNERIKANCVCSLCLK